jgi:hypothetical protein
LIEKGTTMFFNRKKLNKIKSELESPISQPKFETTLREFVLVRVDDCEIGVLHKNIEAVLEESQKGSLNLESMIGSMLLFTSGLLGETERIKNGDVEKLITGL